VSSREAFVLGKRIGARNDLRSPAIRRCHIGHAPEQIERWSPSSPIDAKARERSAFAGFGVWVGAMV
jgi:hypothetical protein